MPVLCLRPPSYYLLQVYYNPDEVTYEQLLKEVRHTSVLNHVELVMRSR